MPGKSSSKGGFSLIEILTVLAVMSILAVGAASMLTSSPIVGSLDAGSDIFTSTIREAQVLAYSKQVSTGVIIENSPSSTETHLRRMAVVVQTGGVWQLASTPVRLPRNIFFVPGSSSEGTNEDGSLLPVGQLSSVTLPGQAAGSQNYFFAFDAQGFADPSGGQAVLSAGTLTSSGTLIVKNGLARLLTIRKLGQVVAYDFSP